MATISSLTAERMLEIEAGSVVDGDIVAGDLILTKHDGTQINAGPVAGPPGPQGPTGAPGVSIVGIPGEIRLWSGSVLPDRTQFGFWTWANGGDFLIADHPLAAQNIDDAWNTAFGMIDPGPGRFRVPDLRGVVPAGLDAMPVGSSRVNRLTRAEALITARNTGQETHVMTLAETPSHSHRSDGAGGAGGVVTVGGVDHTHSGSTQGRDRAHVHGMSQSRSQYTFGTAGILAFIVEIIGAAGAWNTGVSMNNESSDHAHAFNTGGATAYSHQHAIYANGSDGAHENVQPTVMVPYIVKLDG